MRSRCRPDLSGLNSFIMRAGRLEGPPAHKTHKEPWKHQTQYYCLSSQPTSSSLLLCVGRWMDGRNKTFLIMLQITQCSLPACESERHDLHNNVMLQCFVTASAEKSHNAWPIKSCLRLDAMMVANVTPASNKLDTWGTSFFNADHGVRCSLHCSRG